MQYVAAIQGVLFFGYFAWHWQQVATRSKCSILGFVCSTLLLLSSYAFLYYGQTHPLALPVHLLIMIVGIKLSTGAGWSQAIFGGSCLFSMFSYQSVSLIVYAFITNSSSSLPWIIHACWLVILFSIPIAFVCVSLLRKRLLSDQWVYLVSKNLKHQKRLIIYQFITLIDLIIVSQAVGFITDLNWYFIAILSTCSISFGMLIHSSYCAYQEIQLDIQAQELSTIENQYRHQLEHYMAYKNYTDSIRSFIHDYRATIPPLAMLIQSQEYDQALRLIRQMDSRLEYLGPSHTYSSNAVLDSMMVEIAATCKENGIHLTHHINFPMSTKLSLLGAIEIFSNATNNAIEACLKLPPGKRYIDIHCERSKHWETLRITNSYNGQSIKKGKSFLTTKEEPQKHGLGLSIIQKTAKEAGGNAVFKSDQLRNEFSITVMLPRYTETISLDQEANKSAQKMVVPTKVQQEVK